jgi:hypothetical protein
MSVTQCPEARGKFSVPSPKAKLSSAEAEYKDTDARETISKPFLCLWRKITQGRKLPLSTTNNIL